MARPNILIVEDDKALLQFLETALMEHGFQPIACSDGKSALNAFDGDEPDLVLLDVQLPDLNGFELCSRIRGISLVPIIFISCLSDGSDIIRGLELGGDDYVTKPFDLHQLIARIRANLRRAPLPYRSAHMEWTSSQGGQEQLIAPKIWINFHTQIVTVDDKEIELSNKEFHLFVILARYPDKVFHYDELYTLIWGSQSMGDTRALKVHISHLRKKFEGSSISIHNARGTGYRISLR